MNVNDYGQSDTAKQSSASEQEEWNERARSVDPRSRGAGRQWSLGWPPYDVRKVEDDLTRARNHQRCAAPPEAKVLRVIADPTGEGARIPGDLVRTEHDDWAPWVPNRMAEVAALPDGFIAGAHKCPLEPEAALKTLLMLAAWFGADVFEIEGRWGLRWFFDVELSPTSSGPPEPYIHRFVLIASGTRCEIVEARLPAATPFILDRPFFEPEVQYWGARPLADRGPGTRT